MNEEYINWLNNFHKEHGRPLRVLHIGNIANNAYLNAKFLRHVGVEADVLCYDYFHVMACPEWEDLEINGEYGDDYAPSFSQRNLQSYKRPDWFIQGPFHLCVAFIVARRKQQRVYAWMIHKCMDYSISHPKGNVFFRTLFSWFAGPQYRRHITSRLFFKINNFVKLLLPQVLYSVLIDFKKAGRWIKNMLVRQFDWSFLNRCRAYSVGANQAECSDEMINFDRIVSNNNALFNKCFPDRRDQLTASDQLPYMAAVSLWKKIFNGYDIVQCYSTDPIHALMAEFKPYVAFEHGTLRTFTMGDDPLHRLTSLSYRNADHVFITNGDCLDYALKLGVKKYSAMIHPVDIDQHELLFSDDELANVKKDLNADVLLFCPLRHDWQIKGTDVHLKALPKIIKQVRGAVKLLVTDWGGDLEKSRELIKSFNCEDHVVWLPPLCRVSMIKYMKASDVVLDQIALPHFGSTAPQALAAGTPVISSYEPASTEWIVDKPAPIIPAFSSGDVVSAISIALDKVWRENFVAEAKAWIYEQHHQNRLINEHLKVYNKILNKSEKEEIYV